MTAVFGGLTFEEDEVNNMLEAEFATPKTTVDVFVVMNRFGDNYWCASTTYYTLEDAQRSAGVDESIQAWKIVKVSGLPVNVPAGEAVTPNVKVTGAPAHSD